MTPMWSLREHIVLLWVRPHSLGPRDCGGLQIPSPATSRRVPGVHQQLDDENPQERKVPGSTHPSEPLRR